MKGGGWGGGGGRHGGKGWWWPGNGGRGQPADMPRNEAQDRREVGRRNLRAEFEEACSREFDLKGELQDVKAGTAGIS